MGFLDLYGEGEKGKGGWFLGPGREKANKARWSGLGFGVKGV